MANMLRNGEKFDTKTALLLVLLNALIVFLINLDGQGGGVRAGLVQMFLTFLIIGLAMPHIRRLAHSLSAPRAYLIGALLLPAGILLFTRSVHWYFASPNLFGTTLYLVLATFIAGPVFIFLKRNQETFTSRRVRRFIDII